MTAPLILKSPICSNNCTVFVSNLGGLQFKNDPKRPTRNRLLPSYPCSSKPWLQLGCTTFPVVQLDWSNHAGIVSKLNFICHADVFSARFAEPISTELEIEQAVVVALEKCSRKFWLLGIMKILYQDLSKFVYWQKLVAFVRCKFRLPLYLKIKLERRTSFSRAYYIYAGF